MSQHYVLMEDPNDYRFFSDDMFPESIHNFKILFAAFILLFWIFRSVLRWKENDILVKERDKRNIVCVNISRHTARGLTRDHLLRFLSRLYKKENKLCGKVFLPASIRQETFRTAFVFPQMEQGAIIDHLDAKYRPLIPLPITNPVNNGSPGQLPQFKPGQVVSFEVDNDTVAGAEHEPQVLITFYVNSHSDSGGSIIFPFLGVKTSSIYQYYDKYYGTRSDGVYLTPGNGLYPSRSRYQHGNLRDIPSSKERLVLYRDNQISILKQWLQIYKLKLSTGRYGPDPFNQPLSMPLGRLSRPIRTTQTETLPLITNGHSEHAMSDSAPNSPSQDQIIDIKQPFGEESDDGQNQQIPDDDFASPDEGDRTPRGNDDNDNDTEHEQDDTIDEKVDEIRRTTTATTTTTPPPQTGLSEKKKYKHISGVYTSEATAVQRRVNAYLTDPRYARSGAPFQTLPKTCPLTIKSMQALPSIIVKNSKAHNGSLVTLKVPLSTMDKLLQAKHQNLKQVQQDKKAWANLQEKEGADFGTKATPNDSFIPLVFVVAGTIGDCIVSEIIHLDFAQSYTRDLYPQRHLLKASSSYGDNGNNNNNNNNATTTATNDIDVTNIIDVADSVLSTRDLYNPVITNHVNPDTIDWDNLDPNAKPSDTRLPLQYQLLRSGRVSTPFYDDIYDLRRPVFSTIETGLFINSLNYNNYYALFPTFGLSQESDGTDCNICYCEPKRVIALPCRHIATCQTCAQQLVKCCLCRSDIQSYCTFLVTTPDGAIAQPSDPFAVVDPIGSLVPTEEPRNSPQQQARELGLIREDANPATTTTTTTATTTAPHTDVVTTTTTTTQPTTQSTTSSPEALNTNNPTITTTGGGRVLGGGVSGDQGDGLTAQQRAIRSYLQQQDRRSREQVEQQQQQQQSSVFGALMRQQTPNDVEELGLAEDEEGTHDDDDDDISSTPTSPLPSQSHLQSSQFSPPQFDHQISVRSPVDSENGESEESMGSLVHLGQRQQQSRSNNRTSVRSPFDDRDEFVPTQLPTHLEEETHSE